MKKISVLIPCYNEEENVVPMSEAVADIFAKELPEYDYELVFIDIRKMRPDHSCVTSVKRIRM